MRKHNAARHFEPGEPGFYPLLLLSDAQQALSAMADTVFRYEALLKMLEERRQSASDVELTRDRLLKRLARERRGCVETLDEVQTRMSEVVGRKPPQSR